MKKTFNL